MILRIFFAIGAAALFTAGILGYAMLAKSAPTQFVENVNAFHSKYHLREIGCIVIAIAFIFGAYRLWQKH